MSKDIQYIKLVSVDMQAACKASATSTSASNKVKGADGQVWANTVAHIMESVDFKGVSRDTSKDGIKKLYEILSKAMASHLLSILVIPETGKDREGKDFKVVNEKTKEPKWSSWDQTRRIFAYLGDIAKVISHGHSEVLYPESMKVAARCDVLSLCKSPETLHGAIERLTEELQDRFNIVETPADVLKARTHCNSLVVNNLSPIDEASDLINKLDAILYAVDEDERDVIRTNLNKLVKYFLAKAA